MAANTSERRLGLLKVRVSVGEEERGRQKQCGPISRCRPFALAASSSPATDDAHAVHQSTVRRRGRFRSTMRRRDEKVRRPTRAAESRHRRRWRSRRPGTQIDAYATRDRTHLGRSTGRAGDHEHSEHVRNSVAPFGTDRALSRIRRSTRPASTGSMSGAMSTAISGPSLATIRSARATFAISYMHAAGTERG